VEQPGRSLGATTDGHQQYNAIHSVILLQNK
jgi:hypothetical protein